MNWVALTQIGGGNIYVNLNQVVAIEPHEQSGHLGARLRTTLFTKDGLLIDYFVQESAKEILEPTGARALR